VWSLMVHQRVPFVEAITDPGVQIDGILITRYRSVVVTQMMVRVSQAVYTPAPGRYGRRFPMRLKGSLAAGESPMSPMQCAASPRRVRHAADARRSNTCRRRGPC
jgi:hypothetical protein